MNDVNIMNKALKVAGIPRLQSRSDVSCKIISLKPRLKTWRKIIPFTVYLRRQVFFNLTTSRTSIVAY